MIREIEELIPNKKRNIGLVEVDDILEECEDKILETITEAIESTDDEVQKLLSRMLELEKEVKRLTKLLEDEKMECYKKIKILLS